MTTCLMRGRLQWYGHLRKRKRQELKQQMLSMTGQEKDLGKDHPDMRAYGTEEKDVQDGMK